MHVVWEAAVVVVGGSGAGMVTWWVDIQEPPSTAFRTPHRRSRRSGENFVRNAWWLRLSDKLNYVVVTLAYADLN